jgi:hypothetical protein
MAAFASFTHDYMVRLVQAAVRAKLRRMELQREVAINEPISTVVSESIGVVIGNLITSYATEVRHYHITAGVDGTTTDFTVGIKIKHFTETEKYSIRQEDGTYLPTTYPCIKLNKVHASIRQPVSFPENEEDPAMECYSSIEPEAREKVRSPAGSHSRVTHAIYRYMLLLHSRPSDFEDDNGEVHAQIHVTAEPNRPPSFTLVSLHVEGEEPPHAQWVYTVFEVKPRTYTVGAPMKPPVAAAQPTAAVALTAGAGAAADIV